MLIPENIGLIYLKYIFLMWIKRVQLYIKSSKRIIAILKFALIDFSIAKGFDEISFIKNASASLVSILSKKLNPTSFLMVLKIFPIIYTDKSFY